jgi:hypothetical protein
VPRADDHSEEHLQWLVENRSLNQKTTLDLYVVMTRNDDAIMDNAIYAELAEDLAGVAFSLWRAVFLSDFTRETESQLRDVTAFLGALISHNAIGYPQDRSAREWTFQYYLDNARHRLVGIARKHPAILEFSDIEAAAAADSAKQDWSIAHRALEKAVLGFDRITAIGR